MSSSGFHVHGRAIKIFAANANQVLAEQIANTLSLPLGKSEVKRFSDQESSVSINESVRGYDCYIIQSTCQPANENLMDLLIMIDALKRASANRITAVMPYFGYARQDRKAKPRDPISAKLIAELIEAAGADRVISMDLHVPQIQGFFNIPVDHVRGIPLLADAFLSYLKQQNESIDDYVIVSPDLGSVDRVRGFALKVNAPMAIVDKRRPAPNVSEVMNIIGDVKDKKLVIVDDMVDTAGTLCGSAKALIEKGGAKEIFAFATHGVLSGPAIKRIEESAIKKLFLLDTIPLSDEKKIDKIEVISVAKVFSSIIKNIFSDESISAVID